MSTPDQERLVADLSRQLNVWNANAHHEMGAFDAESEMKPEEIVDLKHALVKDERFQSEVCVHIAVNTLLDLESQNVGVLTFSTREDFAAEASRLSLEHKYVLDKALALPNDEWPKGLAAPDAYQQAVSELREAQARAQDGGAHA